MHHALLHGQPKMDETDPSALGGIQSLNQLKVDPCLETVKGLLYK